MRDMADSLVEELPAWPINNINVTNFHFLCFPRLGGLLLINSALGIVDP